MTGPKDSKSQVGEKDRRAQALRENLRRRKLQARARTQDAPKTASGDAGKPGQSKPER